MSGGGRSSPPPAYVCGHAPRELERLALQSRIYEGATHALLADAGIGAGHHVIDVGCGAGDVSVLAARVVGPTGRVTGVDRSAAAAAAATARARAEGLAQVEFAVGELESWAPQAPVDAVIGRFVLMHQAEPTALLARARTWVRRGGVVAFLESDNAACRPGMHSRPHSPTYDAIVRVWQDVIRAAGAHVDMGARLEEAFVAAGMSAPVVRLDTYVSGDPASPIFRFAAESLRSMLPLAAAVGVPAPAEADVDGIEAALRAEVKALGAELRAPPAYGVWARVD